MEDSLESIWRRARNKTSDRPDYNSNRPLTRVLSMGLLAAGVLLAATSSQALTADLTGVGYGTTHLDVDGYSLTVSASSSRFLPLEQLSISFNDGPVSLNSIDVLFATGQGFVLANLMGDTALIYAQEGPGVVTYDAGGVQGTRIATLSFGRDIQIQSIDFDIVSVGGVGGQDPGPTSPIPEPGAALLFSAGLGLIALQRKERASSRA